MWVPHVRTPVFECFLHTYLSSKLASEATGEGTGLRAKFISLDLDGTIVSREYVDYFWLELVPRLYAEQHGLDLEEARGEVIGQYDEVGPRDLRWYIPQYWFERLGLGEELMLKALEEASRLVVPYEDAIQFLEATRGRFELVVSTSAHRLFINLVFKRVPRLAELLSHVFSSVSDFSLPGKPPEFYRGVLERLRASPQEVVHVGDDEEADYRVPTSLGIKAYLIDRDSDRGLRSLTNLLQILNV